VYKVECFHCKRSYDALTAADCDCLQQPRSLRCPHCAACFCDAPKAFKTNFWAEAPRELWSRRKAVEPDAPVPPDPAAIIRPLILFADDDAVSRAIARRLLGSMGLGVVVAANGEDALRLARELRPEMLVTDAFMPKLDGRELARMVKQENPRMKVIVISGVYKDPRYKHEALKTFQVDEYLTKPVSPRNLRAAVVRHLGE
jgi:CheY-like chemotaxis protein